MSWYDYNKVNENEVAPSIIEDIHTAFYSKDYDWACYDERHSDKDDSFSSIIAFVENGYRDRFSSDKSRVFIHCTNGNTYELKVEKVNKNQGYYYGDKKSLIGRLLEWFRNLKCSRVVEDTVGFFWVNDDIPQWVKDADKSKWEFTIMDEENM